MKDGIIVKPAPFAGRPGWGMRLFSGLAASRRLSASGVLGVAFVVIVGAGTLFAPLFTPFDPLALGADTLQAPGWGHPRSVQNHAQRNKSLWSFTLLWIKRASSHLMFWSDIRWEVCSCASSPACIQRM